MRRSARSRYGPFHTERCGETPPELLQRGIDQLNRGEYFEQHETLEVLWRAETDDVRYLYQGILLVGVGLLHLQRGNFHGADVKLATGVRLLQWFRPVCQGVDVAALIADATRAREAILGLGPTRLAELDASLLPTVRYATAETIGSGQYQPSTCPRGVPGSGAILAPGGAIRPRATT